MRKKVTQRLVSGVLCLAMGITLISPVTSRAAEASEPTTQATTESASTETTTENPVTTETSIETEAATTEVQAAPSEDVVITKFRGFGKFQHLLKILIYAGIRIFAFIYRKRRKFRYLDVYIYYETGQPQKVSSIYLFFGGSIHRN